MSSTLPKSLSGSLQPVAKVAKQRTGERPHPAKVWRWCTQGLKGGTIRLQAVKHSGQWLTTEQAFDQFLLEQTEAARIDRQPKSADCDSVDDETLRSLGLL